MSLKAGDDLFKVLGQKTSAEGASKDAPSQSVGSVGESSDSKAKSDENIAAAKSQVGAEVGSAESKSASSKEEPSGSSEGLLGDLTPESAYKEIKKLREENKSYRIKYAEKLEQMKLEADSVIASEREKFKEYESAKKELEKIKAFEEDKKRSQEEKLANRETRIAELQSSVDQLKEAYEKQLRDKEVSLQAMQAEREAELEVHKVRLQEELSKIPQKFQEYANLIVKGAGDPRDALVALTEAKLSGIFEEKRVVVNHSVPGASDGARVNKDQLDHAAKEQRANRSSSQKIKAALDEIRGGNKNPAFKTR